MYQEKQFIASTLKTTETDGSLTYALDKVVVPGDSHQSQANSNPQETTPPLQAQIEPMSPA
eukprot:Awhi_evm3s706